MRRYNTKDKGDRLLDILVHRYSHHVVFAIGIDKFMMILEKKKKKKFDRAHQAPVQISLIEIIVYLPKLLFEIATRCSIC